MRNGTRHLRRGSSVIIETLEDRQLMSAAAVHVAAPVNHETVAELHAEVAAEAAAKAAAKAAAAKGAATKSAVVKAVTPTVTAPISTLHQTPSSNTTPNLVGTWTGTMQFDGAATASVFSINFQFQLEAAASGTFNLGPAIGNQSPQSTMVVENHNNVRALILTNNLWVGFTGVLVSTGNEIYGRFAYDSSTGWQTGSFTVTRN